MSATLLAELSSRLSSYGEAMTLHHRVMTAPSSSSLQSYESATVATAFTGFRYEHERVGADGVTVLDVNQRVIALGSEISPEVGDAVVIGGEEHEIHNLHKHVVEGTVVFYELEI